MGQMTRSLTSKKTVDDEDDAEEKKRKTDAREDLDIEDESSGRQ
jgi:hypothetical protein